MTQESNVRHLRKSRVLSPLRSLRTSSEAKGTKSTSFLTHVRKERIGLVPLAYEDERQGTYTFYLSVARNASSFILTEGVHIWHTDCL